MSFYDLSVLIGNGQTNYGTLEHEEGNKVIRSWLGFGEERLVVSFDKSTATVLEKILVRNEN